MKLVFLLYLEDDDRLVREQLDLIGVRVFSALPLEGHGTGGSGWYGDVAPYRSRMVFAAVSDEEATTLLEVVRTWPVGQDPSHPIRAFRVNIEEAVTQVTTPGGSS